MTDRAITARMAPSAERTAMTPGLTWLFAAAVGVIVLPLYAAQPLQGPIATSFGVPSGSMAYILPNIANFWNPNSSSPPLGFVLS